MISTAILTSVAPSPHLTSPSSTTSTSSGLTLSDISPEPRSNPPSLMSRTSLQSSAPRRRRRPPPLSVPKRAPTSLPNSFYAHTSPAPSAVDPTLWKPDNRAAAASTKGNRGSRNEDRVFASSDIGLYGVCDGHGGDRYAGEMPSHLVAQRIPQMLKKGLSVHESLEQIDRDICDMFRGVEEQQMKKKRMSLNSHPFSDYSSSAIPTNSSLAYVGTTVTTVQVERGERLQVAHVGDSRAMLIDRKGVPTTLLEDHYPDRPDETARIEAAGGDVLQGRVEGVLAVSRAVGDIGLKNVVPAIPDETEFTLSHDDQLLVLATDGLWDVVTEKEIIGFLKSRPLVSGTNTVPSDLKQAAQGLVDLAVHKGSRDDTSVVLVDLRVLE